MPYRWDCDSIKPTVEETMSIEERIAKLERDNRISRLIAFGLAFATVSALGYSFRPLAIAADRPSDGDFNVIRAQAIEIMNVRGVPAVHISSKGIEVFEPGKHLQQAIVSPTGIIVHDESGSVDLSGRGIVVTTTKAPLVRAYRDADDNFTRAIAASDKANLDRLSDIAARAYGKLLDDQLHAVVIGQNGSVGGKVVVYNAFGKRVASVQPSDTNEGLISVANVDGEMKKVLEPH
jgi:hypothetical protein